MRDNMRFGGSQTLVLTYIDDNIRAKEPLLRTEGANGKVLNIGSEGRFGITEIAQSVRALCDSRSEVLYTIRQKEEAVQTSVDITVARTLPSFDGRVGSKRARCAIKIKIQV